MKKKDSYFWGGLVLLAVGITMCVLGTLLSTLLPGPWEDRMGFTGLIWVSIMPTVLGANFICEYLEGSSKSK